MTTTPYQMKKHLLGEALLELRRALYAGSIVQVLVLDTGSDSIGNATRTVKLLAPITTVDGDITTTDITVYAHRVLQPKRHTTLRERKNCTRGLTTHATDTQTLIQMLSFEVFGMYDMLTYNEVN